MMKNSGNYPFFMVTVLIALWITPIFSRYLLHQTPFLTTMGQPVNFTVTGENISEAIACDWFKGYDISNETLVSVYIRNTSQITNRRGPHITVDNNCTLMFRTLEFSDLDNYVLLLQFPNGILRDSIIMNGAQRFELSSIAFLAVAGLVSSFTLF